MEIDMLTRTIADLTFEVHSPSTYRLVVPDDPARPGHAVWMMYRHGYWWIVYQDGKGSQQERRFASRTAVLSLLTSRRVAM
jgi:hypothetical protein